MTLLLCYFPILLLHRGNCLKLKIEKNVVLSFLSCTVSEIGPIAGFCAHDHVPILPQFGGVPVGSDRPW